MILADTCVVIWLAQSTRSPSLSKAAADAIRLARMSGGIAIAGVTLHELAWLVKSGRTAVSTSLGEFLDAVESHFVVLPIDAAIAQIAVELPAKYPKDPMDRIIGATALARGIPLVTRDRAIRKSKAVPVIW